MILPGATLGMLGGGQLARMFASEARRMGYGIVIVDPDPHAPAAQLADRHIQLPWDDPQIVRELVNSCAAVTTEWENVPASLLRACAEHLPVRPGADSVAITQDRIREKEFLNRAGIPTVAWVEITEGTDLEAAWAAVGGLSGVLKTARMGYDGKGQIVVQSLDELRAAHHQLHTRCILERRVSLELEVSVMVSRGADGQIMPWPIAENVHRHGILHSTLVPARIPEVLMLAAGEAAVTIVRQLDYVGVLGVEYFVADGGQLFVNELAPRPHNSGHWTIDVPLTSQFEQQVRIVAGLPLGVTWKKTEPIAMLNILGDVWPSEGEPDWAAALALPSVKLHLYGKSEHRPGRKMGHLTATAINGERALATATEAWHLLHRDGDEAE